MLVKVLFHNSTIEQNGNSIVSEFNTSSNRVPYEGILKYAHKLSVVNLLNQVFYFHPLLTT